MNKILLSIAMSWLIGIGAFAQNLGSHLLFTAKLEGRQEIPAVATPAGGIGALTLSPNRDTLFVNVSWHSLSSAFRGVHIHDNPKGVVGKIVVDLVPFVRGNRVVTTILNPTPAFIARLMRGGLYLNVHTANNPTGEIRGQLYLEKDKLLYARLSNSQEPVLPTPVATGKGLGTFKVSKDSSGIKINVVAQGLTGPVVSAHFHRGLPGQVGPVVKDLTPLIVGGNSIIGTVDTLPTPPATSFIRDLLAGRIYINLHTAANPDGEQRGQVLLDTANLLFDVSATAAQNVPVSTNARAKAAVLLRITPTFDSLIYEGVFAGTTQPLWGANLREASIGQTGIVSLNLVDGFRDSSLVDTVPSLNSAYPNLVRYLLEGNLYFEIVSGANQTGEARGQVRRAARIGFTAGIDGRQERPLPTSSPALGTAYASIDADFTLLHWATVATGLTSPVTGAHFHGGRANEVGGVIYDLFLGLTRKDTVVAGHGYITNPATPSPVTSLPLNALRFLKDSIYINIHTITFPDGEIRGQMSKSGRVEVITGLNNVNSTLSNSELAPNPTSGFIRMAVNSTQSGTGILTVTDMVGTEILSSTVNITTGNNAFELNLESLTNGMYYVQIENGSSKMVKKVVKY